MKTLPADLEALMPKPAVRAVYADAYNTAAVKHGFEQGGYLKSPDYFTADQVREAIRGATEIAQDDTKRLDWIVRQADEFSCSMIVDAPGDGEYIVHGMGGYGQGKTPREAIDNAMRFNAAAAIRSGGEAGS